MFRRAFDAPDPIQDHAQDPDFDGVGPNISQGGLVDLELGILNNVRKESTPGTATVALPYRGGAPVPYPFVPPQRSA